jgi:nucleotide-binding universal stress UspA family protein
MSGILVGVDGSGHSQRALDWAIREAVVRHAPLTVLTVNQVPASAWTGAPVTYPQDESTEAQLSRAAQDAADKSLAQLGESRPASVTVRSVTGSPAAALISASSDADLIVVGSRGAGGFTRLLLGSVSTQVAHHAHCPVVIIPAELAS